MTRAHDGRNFSERLRTVQARRNSLLCVGLDPDIAKIPAHILKRKNPALEFCLRIVESTSDLVCAYKLNLAFFEAFGERGWSTIHQLLAAIPRDVITIGDAKRGDIGNTAEMYARVLFRDFGFDATTVNAYMGEDSVRPFISDPQRGAFVLVLTSNPGARDFQHLKTNGKPLYEQVARRAKQWNEHGNIGCVVGATRPRELQRIRRLVPRMPLLIPGVGTQGGDLRLAVRHGCDADGLMAIINASRSIIYASAGTDFARAARSAALGMRDDINGYRG